MNLVKMVLRKMLKNKSFIFFLLLGLLVSAALMSSIPMYTYGILQKSIINDMENYQKQNNEFPGAYTISYTEDDSSISIDNGGSVYKDSKALDIYKKKLTTFSNLDEYISKKVKTQVKIPVLSYSAYYSTDQKVLSLEDGTKPDNLAYVAKLESFKDIEKHVNISGKTPADHVVNGVYEVMVSNDALSKLGMELGRVYTLDDKRSYGFSSVKVMVVGTFNIKDSKDLYWLHFNEDFFSEGLIMDESLFKKDFIFKQPTQIMYAKWCYDFDYHKLKISDIDNIADGNEKINDTIRGYYNKLEISPTIMGLIGQYVQKENSLKNTMWVLNISVICVLYLYFFMVSTLIVRSEGTEISLLSSRGAKKIQIVFIYVLEGLIMGTVSLVFGPMLGVLFCKILGASNGFLEFVNRKPLPVILSGDTYGYVLLGLLFFIIALIIPVYATAKNSIVNYKRNASRQLTKTLWEKYFIDCILLGIAVYGYYAFTQRQKLIKHVSSSLQSTSIDPSLFLTPIVFMIAVCLLFLRLYPYVIRFIYWIGRKFWSPPIYATLIQVGRSVKDYHFLMTFLIITVSVGMFSSSAARTINSNIEERIKYQIGADMDIHPLWSSEKTKDSGAPVSTGEQNDGDKPIFQNTKYKTLPENIYLEPSFEPYTNIPGVEHVTKVFVKNTADVFSQESNQKNVSLMGIEPYDFGNVAWIRKGMLPHSINEYLNILTNQENGCLISQSLSEAGIIHVGDKISVGWEGNNTDLIVCGIVNYWPSWDPDNRPQNAKESDNDSTKPMLVVANLKYIQNKIPIEPYNIWLKLKPGASSEKIYQYMKDKNLYTNKINDTKQQIIAMKNDPIELAINGSMNIGFIMSAIICLFGFILYWVLSIKSRTLQIGVLRAIGMSAKKVRLMMIWEQVLTSVVAMIGGVVVGLATSALYLPFFQVSLDASSKVPPFKVISYLGDRVKIYCFMIFIFAVGFGLITYVLSSMKINNVLKLGED
ncbi:MAG: FtsX-like permease family protein [Bacillota bacterium]|nr:FtsX-like permease family protein [Bacillota bacterium]